MAENTDGNPALQAAAKYRQFAGQFALRQHAQNAFVKNGRVLANCPAAYSTFFCSVCGAETSGTGLERVCGQGHRLDQDINAAQNLLGALERASISAPAVIIPVDLQRCLRYMAVSGTMTQVA